jgi:hypothetical protein
MPVDVLPSLHLSIAILAIASWSSPTCLPVAELYGEGAHRTGEVDAHDAKKAHRIGLSRCLTIVYPATIRSPLMLPAMQAEPAAAWPAITA